MRNAAKLLVAVAFLAWGAAANSAVVIYDNNITATNSFVSDVAFPTFVADDFRLNPGANVITDVHWTGLYAFNNTPQPNDLFTIQFFNDVAGAPATIPFLSLAIGNASRTDTAINLGPFDLYAYSADVAPIVLAANTTFWMSIFNDTTSDANDNWFWGMVDNGGNSFQRAALVDPWTAQGNGQQFQLTGTGVPEPSPLALLVIAAIGLLLYRWRATSSFG